MSDIPNPKSEIRNPKLLYLFTRTPLHVGAGSSVGAIDQPIIRERHTGFPVIPGSSIKGVLADGHLQRTADGQLVKDEKGRSLRTDTGRQLFGKQDHEVGKDESGLSGSVSFGEAKLLAFPVRSAKGCFAWITSRLALERWSRDTGASLKGIIWPVAMEAYGDEATIAAEEKVVLEDYQFDCRGAFAIPDGLKRVFSNKDCLWSALAPTHLCLISDDMMAHFARSACEVSQHVRIDDEHGTAADQGLFNQENVPAETLFYSLLHELRVGCFAQLTVPDTIQVGGDGTTGLGYCTTELA